VNEPALTGAFMTIVRTPLITVDDVVALAVPSLTAQKLAPFPAKISVPVVVMTILFVATSGVSSVCVNTTLIGYALAAYVEGIIDVATTLGDIG
jgi:hypothetical protein